MSITYWKPVLTNNIKMLKVDNNYYFSFEIGDISGDGHSSSINAIFKSSISSKEFSDILDKITEIMGINLNDTCNDYEDCFLPKKVQEILNDTGFDTSNLDEGKIHLGDIETFKIIEPDDFINIIIHCAKYTYNKLYDKELFIEYNNEIPRVYRHWGYGTFDTF